MSSSAIRRAIEERNKENQKALSVFLTCGYPDLDTFREAAFGVLKAGADMLELGIPFSDPIADGPVIQASSQRALENGVTVKTVLNMAGQIKDRTGKPLILMGYANPLLQYGLKNFVRDARNSGVDGLIVPDIPLEEYHSFWSVDPSGLDIILLTTPTTSAERVTTIDQLSRGFVYCVSVTGTTGMQETFPEAVTENVKRTYDQVSTNKMLIGFGISRSADILHFAPYCDGFIVGSAVIRSLAAEADISAATVLVSTLRQACNHTR